MAAYTDHAAVLGQENDKVYAYLHEALIVLTRKDLGINDLLGLVLKCGEMNFRAMELLDAGNTGTYGHPVPTEVPLGHIAGKAILVSGHDLKDLDELLKQTAGKNINVYTHGEMLPTHAYPELKKYQHFYGHYGTAWQNQQKEFTNFPGAILMTTNCLQKPQASYLDHIFTYLGGRTVASRLKPQASYLNHIFTTGNVGWPGVNHLDNYNFTTVIEKALATQGFPTDEARDSVLVCFGRNSVLGVAPKVIDAVKSGDIKHFFLVGGCDGAKPGRSYYSDFVEKAPKDTVILTLACGKFRFFDKKLGDIGGIPRLLDVGQCNDSYSATQIAFAERVSLRPRWLKCNDSYSAIQIALALADAFECDVNELPLTLVLSWYEQKAVAILLTLLHLGLKDIYIGPSLPAFITPNVLNVLVEKFNLHPITTPENDLALILG
ncbi:MAG: Hydroxylamine reductase [Syntrophomonadaceae bacterium]|nr:Hydroxylamine reductase [Bacillota bacterium]